MSNKERKLLEEILMTITKTEALLSAAHINRAVENINAGYDKISEILEAHQEDQAILVRAPIVFSDYGKCLSDVTCPVCGCSVAAKMKLLGSCTNGTTVEYFCRDRLKWCPYTIRWMLDCPRCGLRTPRCKTLQEAIDLWAKLSVLHGLGGTWD